MIKIIQYNGEDITKNININNLKKLDRTEDFDIKKSNKTFYLAEVYDEGYMIINKPILGGESITFNEKDHNLIHIVESYNMKKIKTYNFIYDNIIASKVFKDKEKILK